LRFSFLISTFKYSKIRMNSQTKTNKTKTNKLIVILGPTGAGKSDLALKLANDFNGEIVCADSRQIYTEMTIGTAKPYTAQAVPHHLFDIVKPNESFSVAQYQKLAIKTIKEIQKRGKLPFLVGGTAFYIYSVVEGWQFPKTKTLPQLRQRLENKSPKELFALLRKLDPNRAKNIDKQNKRRLIRAIEIAKQLGAVPSIRKKPLFDCLLLGVGKNHQELAKKIEKRTQEMFQLGLEKEVHTLIKKYGWTPVLQNSIGYSEWKELGILPSLSHPKQCALLKSKPINKTQKQALQKLITLHTLQFAKKQMTWFKKDKRINWIKTKKQAFDLVKKFIQ